MKTTGPYYWMINLRYELFAEGFVIVHENLQFFEDV